MAKDTPAPDDPATRWNVPKLLRDLEEKYKKEGWHSRFWAGEQPFIEGRLSALRESLGGRYRAPSLLGVGGSGVVLQLTDTGLSDRFVALKFPRPVEGQRDLIASLLDKEIESLAALRHGAIVRIHSKGRLFDRHGGVSMFPYYIMDFVKGQSSGEYFAETSVDELQFIHTVGTVVDALAYMHQRDVGHFDIKPDNILIDSSGQPVISDLGTAKKISSTSAETVVACTTTYADPELIAFLDKDPSDKNRARGVLLRSGLRLQWDLVPLGRTLLDWLGYDTKGEKVIRQILLRPYARKYFTLMAARMLRGAVEPWLEDLVGLERRVLSRLKYEDVAAIRDDVRKLTGPALHSEIPELSQQFPQTIQVAAEAPTAFSKRTARLASHPFVRRLGAISQLGTVSLVYETATHTRREHSLGTFHNACRFVRHLNDDAYSPLFLQIMGASDLGAVLAAALLHDIGQFPLAHDLEEIDQTMFDHRELGTAMLAEPSEGGRAREVWDELVAALMEWNTSPESVRAVLGARLNDKEGDLRAKLLHSIVDGPIDADKLDYLRRDSDRLRIPYGHGIDIERILRGLTAIVVDRGAGAIACIGVHEKAKVAAEFVAMARYALFSQAYWHHTVRSSKAMLARLVHALMATLADASQRHQFRLRFYDFVRQLPGSAWPVLSQYPGPVTEQLSPGDAAMLIFLGQEAARAGCSEQSLADELLSRTLYKRLFVFSKERSRDEWKVFADSWDSLNHQARGTCYRHLEALIVRRAREYSEQGRTTSTTDVRSADTLVAHVSQGRPLILIDLPGPRPGSEVALHYVVEAQRRSLRRDERAVGDSNESEGWKEYGGNLRERAGKVRVFCHPSHIDMVEVLLTRPDFVRECREIFGRLDKGH